MVSHDLLINALYMFYAFEEGIVPIKGRSTGDIIADLKNMPPDEARRAKRKYRKIWRQWLRANKLDSTRRLQPQQKRNVVNGAIIRKALKGQL